VTVSVCTESNLGGDRRWLNAYGDVQGLKYDRIAPGGDKSMSGKLYAGPNFHDNVCAPGRIVKAFAGGQLCWWGRLDEPTPEADGISFTATGIMAEGDDYAALGTFAGLPQTNLNALSIDDSVDNATNRGMQWTRLNNSPALYGYEPPTDTVNAALQAAMNRHGWPWYTNSNGSFFWFQWPTTPTYVLIALSTGGGRTRDGMVTDVAARYNNSGASNVDTVTAFTGNSILRAVLGRKESVLDLSDKGNITSANAGTAINNEIAQSGQRAAWTGTWNAPRGTLRTMGGAVVDPALVLPGQMVKVQLSDGGLWGETSLTAPTFVIGQTSYDQDSDAVALTPTQSAPNNAGYCAAALAPVPALAHGAAGLTGRAPFLA
jgi:hypothetical protein